MGEIIAWRPNDYEIRDGRDLRTDVNGTEFEVTRLQAGRQVPGGTQQRVRLRQLRGGTGALISGARAADLRFAVFFIAAFLAGLRFAGFFTATFAAFFRLAGFLAASFASVSSPSLLPEP